MKAYLNLLFCILFTLIACSEKKTAATINLSFPKNGTQLRTKSFFQLKFSKNPEFPFDSIVILLDNEFIATTHSKNDSVFMPKTKIGHRILSLQSWKDGTKNIQKDLQIQILSNSREKEYTYKILDITGHNVDDYTQGLEIDNGYLYEGTGLYGKSKIKKSPLRNDGSSAGVDLEEKYFGEGITILNDKVYQLTWQERKAFVYEKKTLQKITEFDYPINMEGWGLTNNGTHLFASTGGNEIYIINPANFQIENTLHILNYDGVKLKNINELEYVDGFIFANVYQANNILKIDATTGELVGIINMEGLLKKSDYGPETDVLNGIAFDKEDSVFLVTGKNWPKLFTVIFEEKKK